MKYETVFAHERKNWCVPAALQTILNRRGIFVPQQKIYQSFKEGRNKDGLLLGIDELSKFFGNHRLKVEFYNPFLEMIGSDIFLKDELKDEKDILLFYDLSAIYPNLYPPKGHVSHVLDYKDPIGGGRTIEIVDSLRHEDILMFDVHRAIDPRSNRDYGFYVIK